MTSEKTTSHTTDMPIQDFNKTVQARLPTVFQFLSNDVFSPAIKYNGIVFFKNPIKKDHYTRKFAYLVSGIFQSGDDIYVSRKGASNLKEIITKHFLEELSIDSNFFNSPEDRKTCYEILNNESYLLQNYTPQASRNNTQRAQEQVASKVSNNEGQENRATTAKLKATKRNLSDLYPVVGLEHRNNIRTHISTAEQEKQLVKLNRRKTDRELREHKITFPPNLVREGKRLLEKELRLQEMKKQGGYSSIEYNPFVYTEPTGTRHSARIQNQRLSDGLCK